MQTRAHMQEDNMQLCGKVHNLQDSQRPNASLHQRVNRGTAWADVHPPEQLGGAPLHPQEHYFWPI